MLSWSVSKLSDCFSGVAASTVTEQNQTVNPIQYFYESVLNPAESQPVPNWLILALVASALVAIGYMYFRRRRN
jgi:putative exporter of polyketide antibiotics